MLVTYLYGFVSYTKARLNCDHNSLRIGCLASNCESRRVVIISGFQITMGIYLRLRHAEYAHIRQSMPLLDNCLLFSVPNAADIPRNNLLAQRKWKPGIIAQSIITVPRTSQGLEFPLLGNLMRKST